MGIRIPLLAVAGLALLLPVAAAGEPTVAFGTKHAVALRNNGDVLTWGDNVFCELGRATSINVDPAPAVVMRNVKEIAVAVQHTLALTVDGKLYGWGAGPLGMGNTNEQCEGPVVLASLADKTISHIATGYDFSLAVTTTGDLYCAGDNSMGQCPGAKGGRTDVFIPVPYPELAGKVASISAGMFHTLVLTTDGTLYAFGRGRDGQLGNGRTVNGFAAIPDLTGVVSLAAGTWHSAAARADGSVWVWGNNSKSQLCDGATANQAIPTKVALPAAVRVAEVAAGGLSTVMRTSEGALYACGDNQAGLLGLEALPVVPRPTPIPVAPAASLRFSMGGANTAITTDGCAVRLAGANDSSIVSAGGTAASRVFTPRANLSLCGARPDQPLPTLVREWPRGGESGCWTPRVEEDAAASTKYAPLRAAMLAGEALLRENAAFLAAPAPVRFRTALSAGPLDESGARMHVKVVPERKNDGTRIWTTGCGVIPQIDRIGGAIFQVSIFLNEDARAFIGSTGEPPKQTGTVAGYPEYAGRVLITKNGRVPWIPQTLADKLDAEGARREKALAEWNRSRANIKPIDPAAVQKTYEMLKKSDPGGAESYLATVKAQNEEVVRQQQQVTPLTTAALEKQVNDYQQYRSSFTPEQLRAPAVWGNPSGDGKRRMEAKIAALRALSPGEQQQVDEWGRESRAMERQAQAEAAQRKDAADVARLRAAANDLAQRVRALRNAHLERIGPQMTDATADYELTNLRPGSAEAAIGMKRDPAFPDFTAPNRIQSITILFSTDPDPRNSERRAWQQRVKETFNFAALAALLN